MNGILLNATNIIGGIQSALTVEQKLAALRKFGQTPTIFTNKWFILSCASLVFVLIMVLVTISKYRLEKARKLKREIFLEKADRNGLTPDETKLLVEITRRSGLKHPNNIYTMPEAFDSGSAIIMQHLFEKGKCLDERKRYYAEIMDVREKLGFTKSQSSTAVLAGKNGKLSSRQIPVGKKLTLTSNDSAGTTFDAMLAESDDMTFTVAGDVEVLAKPGQSWRVRYRFGAGTWQFNSMILDCQGNAIVLSHSDKVRFVNSRRFLRVAADFPALVADYSCMRKCFSEPQMLPTYYHAKVVELSGPRVKLTTSADIKENSRLLVSFRVDETTLVQDVAEVRSVEEEIGGLRADVDLIGLDEKTISKLVKATNTAALKYGLQFAHEDSAVQQKMEVV